MTKDEALQMCLEYIETDAHERKYVRHAIKAALEAKDEPEGLRDAVFTVIEGFTLPNDVRKILETAYYNTTPPQRTWVGLTDEEKQEWIDAMPNPPQPRHFMVLVNAIESELKEKNT